MKTVADTPGRTRSLFAAVAILASAGVSAQQTPGPVEGSRERVPLHTVVPDYPEVARRDRVEGSVEVCFKIDRKGKPYRIAVRRSSHRVFERSAVRAVRASRYAALDSDEPVPAIKTCRTFTFALEKQTG